MIGEKIKKSTGNSFKRAETVNSPTKVYLTEEVMNPTEENTSWQPSGEITYLGELEQLIK